MNKMVLTNRNIVYVVSVLLFWVTSNGVAQDCELVGIELAKAPKNIENIPAYNLGTKLNFFVNDTAQVTGLLKDYEIEHWVTNTGKDLKAEHQKLALQEVKLDYKIARDTALLTQRGFWFENGQGFTFKLHSWGLPDSLSTSLKVKGNIGYTVLEPGKVITEDITHLAGNFDFETMSMDFKGNTIDLKKVVYGRGSDAYTTFSGSVINNTYEVAIQNLQFLDSDRNVLDELYFGYKNQYNDASTRNRVDLTGTSILRIYYRKVNIKNAVIGHTFGLGF